jgi:hypothetical protein
VPTEALEAPKDQKYLRDCQMSCEEPRPAHPAGCENCELFSVLPRAERGQVPQVPFRHAHLQLAMSLALSEPLKFSSVKYQSYETLGIVRN